MNLSDPFGLVSLSEAAAALTGPPDPLNPASFYDEGFVRKMFEISRDITIQERESSRERERAIRNLKKTYQKLIRKLKKNRNATAAELRRLARILVAKLKKGKR